MPFIQNWLNQRVGKILCCILLGFLTFCRSNILKIGPFCRDNCLIILVFRKRCCAALVAGVMHPG
jgi:hypothetical protein